MHKKYWNYCIVIVALVVSIFAGGCTQQTDSTPSIAPPVASAWMDIELTDVVTGQTFKINDFEGKPVLLESFAVWCPTCLRQQREIKKVKDIEGDAIIHISIDTDPNEDADKIREHMERNGFDWYFVVAPIELTNALTDEFGLVVVNAPSAPVILIYEDQSTKFLRSGVKSAEELISEIEKSGQ